MEKHTKGPWDLVSGERPNLTGNSGLPAWGQRVYPQTGNGLPLAFVYGNSHDTCEANARLIAAAPELLEALELAESMIEETGDNKHDLATMRAAIAKAKAA